MTPGLESTTATPFSDPALVAGGLYAAPDRLAQRTTASHRAEVSGADATDTIAALVADADPTPRVIIDVGCGRGTTTVRLARQYPSAAIVAVDQSPGLLTVYPVRLRLASPPEHGQQRGLVRPKMTSPYQTFPAAPSDRPFEKLVA